MANFFDKPLSFVNGRIRNMKRCRVDVGLTSALRVCDQSVISSLLFSALSPL
eukprot:gene4344-3158_t